MRRLHQVLAMFLALAAIWLGCAPPNPNPNPNPKPDPKPDPKPTPVVDWRSIDASVMIVCDSSKFPPERKAIITDARVKAGLNVLCRKTNGQPEWSIADLAGGGASIFKIVPGKPGEKIDLPADVPAMLVLMKSWMPSPDPPPWPIGGDFLFLLRDVSQPMALGHVEVFVSTKLTDLLNSKYPKRWRKWDVPTIREAGVANETAEVQAVWPKVLPLATTLPALIVCGPDGCRSIPFPADEAAALGVLK